MPINSLSQGAFSLVSAVILINLGCAPQASVVDTRSLSGSLVGPNGAVINGFKIAVKPGQLTGADAWQTSYVLDGARRSARILDGQPDFLTVEGSYGEFHFHGVDAVSDYTVWVQTDLNDDGTNEPLTNLLVLSVNVEKLGDLHLQLTLTEDRRLRYEGASSHPM